MKKILILFIFLVNISSLESQNLAPQFSKTVSFIYLKNGKDFQPKGTGFFVSVLTKDGKRKYHYLITAKHVVQDNGGNFYDNISIRVNTINDSSEYFLVELGNSEENKNVFIHKDESVDLVVIPVSIPSEIDFKSIPNSMIVKRSDYNREVIDVGTDVFFSGLFTPYIGEKKINPIFRFGKLCLIPNEKIEFVNMAREMLLIESSTFGGNSGSPVIFNYKIGNNTIVKLAGVVSGSFNQKNILKGQDEYSLEILSSIGISAITPSEFILEILDYPELIKLRTQ